MLSKIFGRIRKFFSDHYLAVTFVISLVVSFGLALLLFDIENPKPSPPQGPPSYAQAIVYRAQLAATEMEISRGRNIKLPTPPRGTPTQAQAQVYKANLAATEKEIARAGSLILGGLIVGLLFTWVPWFFAKWNALVQGAVGPLGTSNEQPNRDFLERAGAAFGPEFVSNIFSYEDYCKNEYIQDMRKHYVAWILLAISGLITVGAAILVIFRGSEAHARWIEAVGVTLPALVTGVLLKIWLETRDNLDKTRQRTDFIYRQRLRLLLLIGNHAKGRKLSDSIALNRQILDYINLSETPDEPAAAPDAAAAT